MDDRAADEERLAQVIDAQGVQHTRAERDHARTVVRPDSEGGPYAGTGRQGAGQAGKNALHLQITEVGTPLAPT